MTPVRMSDLAYKEFKKFLKENNISSNILRIFLAGNSCSGPIFNITLDEQTNEDLLSPIGELVFLVHKDLFSEFGGFIIQCAEENCKDGFSIDPIIPPKNVGCSTCSGCC
ncbi:HesB-like protein [Clostridium sporogenes]|jgi:HesB-like selenoprotein|uniref:HesB-like protein n=1 Tax=unclassified Clostridium TaxID=2614128 RepID=UPI0013D4F3CA|nr:HesB-like protein [Clostridium sporogenes]NFS27260.1 HesB-like protein [Clostridium sporogenes]